MEATGVMTSRDYRRFHRLVGLNRSVNGIHSAELRRSIERWGNMRIIHIVKTDIIDGQMRMYIVEGQHYFEGVRTLELPIKYNIMSPPNNQEEWTKEDIVDLIVQLNTTQKRWMMPDYIHAFSNVLPEYGHLQDTHEQTGLGYESIAMLALNNPDRRRMGQIIKEKGYRRLNVRFNEMMSYAIDLIDAPQIQGKKRFFPGRLISEFIMYYGRVETYDHNEIKQRMIAKADIIRGLIAAEDELETVLQEEIFYTAEENNQ